MFFYDVCLHYLPIIFLLVTLMLLLIKVIIFATRLILLLTQLILLFSQSNTNLKLIRCTCSSIFRHRYFAILIYYIYVISI